MTAMWSVAWHGRQPLPHLRELTRQQFIASPRTTRFMAYWVADLCEVRPDFIVENHCCGSDVAHCMQWAVPYGVQLLWSVEVVLLGLNGMINLIVWLVHRASLENKINCNTVLFIQNYVCKRKGKQNYLLKSRGHKRLHSKSSENIINLLSNNITKFWKSLQ